MYCPCDDLVVVFRKEIIRTTRRERQCEECHQIIPKGAQYFYWFGKMANCSNGFEHTADFRMCLQCQADWDTVLELLPEDESCHCYGKLEDNINVALENGHIDENHPLVQRFLKIEPEAAGQLEPGLSSEPQSQLVLEGL